MDGDFVTATGDIFGKRRKRRHGEVGRSGEDVKKIENESHKKGLNFISGSTASAPAMSQVFRGVNVAEFIEARALEVSNTVKALREAESMEGKRVFQSLPRHMRRRAASYDIRRIPRNQRKMAAKEDEKNPIKRSKMPSRKYRRRPKILLDEYNRRKRKTAWLETHIWHAKRFKMVEKWGYKMAEHPNDKGLRSAFRASANGCLMQDLSFYGCIEIIGLEEHIIDAFSHLTNKNNRLGMIQKKSLSGERASDVILYKYNCYPHKAIGPVKVIWKPTLLQDHTSPSCVNNVSKTQKEPESQALTRNLWIWCHPSFHDEAVEAIKESFTKADIGKKEAMDVETGEHPVEVLNAFESKQDIKDDKIEQNDNLGDSNDQKPTIFSETFNVNGRITIKSMKLDFVYIRLTGPLSHKILVDSLQLHCNADYNNEHWWGEFYKSENRNCNLSETSEAWEVLKHVTHPAELPPNVVVALTTIDPRMNLPIKKTWSGRESVVKDVPGEFIEKKKDLLTNWSSRLCHSPIWDENVRKEVKGTKITEAELNSLRSAKLDVGEHLEVDEDTSRIPVLLIQRPGGTAALDAPSHFGCGWDVIVPSGWGMAFWVSLIYRGAHACGLREERSIALESKGLYFPKEYPDTVAGEKYIESDRKCNEESYNRHPAGKRPNFEKLGVSSPFAPDWQKLVKEWQRNLNAVLEYLGKASKNGDGMMEGMPSQSKEQGAYAEAEGLISGLQIADDVHSFYVLRDIATLRRLGELLGHCTKKRGKHVVDESQRNSEVLAQKEALLRHLLSIPQNPLIAISLECIGKGEATNNAMICIPSSDDFEKLQMEKKYNGPLEPLHKGPKNLFTTIAHEFGVTVSQATYTGQCTRWIAGYVTTGRYSLRSGKSAGVGFVSAASLAACIAVQKSLVNGCIVLVRNITSQQYRFAKINIIA
ncbi:ribonucleases P/MRP protein subunit POP1-like [Rhopilema esculentum]|uniref:ribonucleases P/MRP protein subunit POP1-like n=1 Tax=Rhopilema esculentum TaxID=499914 RepID=UPI0031CE8696